jgi:23S rRNA (uracil-5-)-methyltransferase RumA
MRSKEFRRLVGELARNAPPVAPRCPHTDQCGGCAFQDRDYLAQVAAKRSALIELYSAAGLLGDEAAPGRLAVSAFNVVPSPDPYAYRTRMDYVATKGRFGLRMRGRFNYIVELTTCHLLPATGFESAHAVWQAAGALGLPDYNIRTHTGFLRYVVVRRSPDDRLLLAAVTAGPEYAAEMEQLAATALAQAGVDSFHWLINATMTDLSFGTPHRHWGAQYLPMRVGAITLAIGPNTFFQNNVHLLDGLLGEVRAAVREHPAAPGAVADLYGGVGLIALDLAPYVGRITTVELPGESADLAPHNIARHNATNVTTVAADAAEHLRSVAPGTYGIVIADPPRTGLGPAACAALLEAAPERIVYVSCNPLTQVEDLHILAQQYRLQRLRGYDMFPHTPHVEAVAVLDRIHAEA